MKPYCHQRFFQHGNNLELISSTVEGIPALSEPVTAFPFGSFSLLISALLTAELELNPVAYETILTTHILLETVLAYFFSLPLLASLTLERES